MCVPPSTYRRPLPMSACSWSDWLGGVSSGGCGGGGGVVRLGGVIGMVAERGFVVMASSPDGPICFGPGPAWRASGHLVSMLSGRVSRGHFLLGCAS
jgi:hypothetical protein